MGWAEAEFQGIDLGDKRRGRLAIQLVERLSERPTASIPRLHGMDRDPGRPSVPRR